MKPCHGDRPGPALTRVQVGVQQNLLQLGSHGQGPQLSKGAGEGPVGLIFTPARELCIQVGAAGGASTCCARRGARGSRHAYQAAPSRPPTLGKARAVRAKFASARAA
jgi:hypothetical protein